MSAPAFEYLGRPDRPAPRRGRILLSAVVALVAVLVGGLLWVNDHVRSSANEDLATAFRAASQQAANGEQSVIGTLAYASPMIWSTQVSEDVRSGLRALVQGSAADVVVRLGLVRQQVAEVRVLPWQGEQVRARDALLALIDDQSARFAGMARDARDIDLVLAGGPLPTGAAQAALRAAGAE